MKLSLLDLLRCPFCAGKLRMSDTSPRAGEIEYNVLSCHCSSYPVVAGIPFLKRENPANKVIALIRAQRHHEALLTLIQPVSPALAPARVKSLPVIGKVRKLRHLAHRMALATWRKRATELLNNAEDSSTARQFFELYWGKKSENFNYHAFRFGQPRHLVALSFATLIRDVNKPILDLACGCGHITRALTHQAVGQTVVGVDDLFFGLYIAKHLIAPGAEFVCCSAEHSLPSANGAFAVAFCSDAFHYITNKAACIRELKRLIAKDGTIFLVWVHNALFRRPYDGQPLPPEGYDALLDGFPHRLVDDRIVLKRYLEKQGSALAKCTDVASVAQAPLLSLVASHRTEVFQDYGPFAQWPHGQGRLALNPLYTVTPDNGHDSFRLNRSYPSAFFKEEHAESAEYLPEHLETSAALFDDLEHGRITPEIESLIDRAVVLDIPERF